MKRFVIVVGRAVVGVIATIFNILLEFVIGASNEKKKRKGPYDDFGGV